MFGPGLVSLVGFSGGSTEIPASQQPPVTVTDWSWVGSEWSKMWIEGFFVFHHASHNFLRNHHSENNGTVS